MVKKILHFIMLDNTDKLANKKTGSKTGKKMYKILINVENALEKYLILCVKIKIIIKKIFQYWHVIMQVERLDLYILYMLFKYFNTMFSMRHDHLPGLLLLTSCPSSCSGSPVQDPCVLCFGRKSIRRGGGGVSVLIICTFSITINNQSQDLNLYL